MASDWPVQQVGSSGEDVRTVQYLLTHHGHPVTVDAIFGPMTEGALQSFQAAHGLVADGIVGVQTWPALLVQVSSGSSGDAVLAAQGQLRTQGWRLAADGVFGPQTNRSVRDFQVAHGLIDDGVVGPLTWQVLVPPRVSEPAHDPEPQPDPPPATSSACPATDRARRPPRRDALVPLARRHDAQMRPRGQQERMVLHVVGVVE